MTLGSEFGMHKLSLTPWLGKPRQRPSYYDYDYDARGAHQQIPTTSALRQTG